VRFDGNSRFDEPPNLRSGVILRQMIYGDRRCAACTQAACVYIQSRDDEIRSFQPHWP
jgi:hypothetical protein